jgi:putative membrane protein (TIGR04086 family)
MHDNRFSNSLVTDLLQIVKAVTLSTLFSLVAVFLFALLLKFVDLSDTAIKCVDQCLKVCAVFFGCFFALRGEKGWLKGLVSGLLIIMITYLLFALIGGFSSSWLILAELALGGIVGFLSGIIAVNLKK